MSVWLVQEHSTSLGCLTTNAGGVAARLQGCGNLAALFFSLHPQVADLFDHPEHRMKFETRHSSHFSFSGW